MKTFHLTSLHDFPGGKDVIFDEESAPRWLAPGGVRGSTMDNRWFWNSHVMTLKIGEHIDTDFSRIRRLT